MTLQLSFLLLGGGVDSFRDKKQGRLSPRRHSCIPDFVKKTFSGINCNFTPLCLKDGRDISFHDLQKVKDQLFTLDESVAVIVLGYEAAADLWTFLEQKENGEETNQTGNTRYIIRCDTAIGVNEITCQSLLLCEEKSKQKEPCIVCDGKAYQLKDFREKKLYTIHT